MAGKIKILVVDDEARFLKTLKQRLELRDFDVTAVQSGQDAIDAAAQSEHDLAIVDLKMPGMDGEQVLEILKRDHPDMEVIILTGHGSVDSAVHCMQVGSYHYLQKPCETDDLLGVLRLAFERRLRRRLELDEQRLKELLAPETSESPLAIFRKLKDLDDDR